MTGERITIGGITYQIEPDGEDRKGKPLWFLRLIGKRGKPVRQCRLGRKRTDGSWHLSGWMRL